MLGAGGETAAVCRGCLVDLDVGEDHHGQGAVEGDRAGEHQIADVVREGTFPPRSRT